MKKKFKNMFGVVAVGAVLCVFGCGAERPAIALYSEADVAVKQAEHEGADQYASLELHTAREHLTKAKEKLDDHQYESSIRHSEKARVDAELAEAKSRSKKADLSTEEVQKNIKSLRDETRRKTN